MFCIKIIVKVYGITVYAVLSFAQLIKAITEKGYETTGNDEVGDLGISGVAKRKLSETPKSTRTQCKKRRSKSCRKKVKLMSQLM